MRLRDLNSFACTAYRGIPTTSSIANCRSPHTNPTRERGAAAVDARNPRPIQLQSTEQSTVGPTLLFLAVQDEFFLFFCGCLFLPLRTLSGTLWNTSNGSGVFVRFGELFVSGVAFL